MRPLDDDPALDLVRATIARGHTARFVARGGSMREAIVDGTVLVWAPLTRAVALGDVLAVVDDAGRLLVHRAIGVRTDGAFLLSGDANRAPDGWFTRDDVLAIVTAAVDEAGVERAISAPRPPKPEPLGAKVRRLMKGRATEP